MLLRGYFFGNFLFSLFLPKGESLPILSIDLDFLDGTPEVSLAVLGVYSGVAQR